MLSGKSLAIADMVGRICLGFYYLLLMVNGIKLLLQKIVLGNITLIDVVWLASELAVIIFLGLFGAAVITRLPPIRSADGIEHYLTAIAGTFMVGLISYLPPATTTSLSLRLLALICILVGMLASAYVLTWLGRAISIVPEARKLATGGPYSIIRHPLYLTEEITVVGVILLNLSPWSVLLGIIHWCLQLRRMVNEERVLRLAFPEYADYARKVPRIIPSLLTKTRSAESAQNN